MPAGPLSVICLTGSAPLAVRDELAATLMEREICEFATTSQTKTHKDVFHVVVDDPWESTSGTSATGATHHLRYIWAPECGSDVEEFVDVILDYNTFCKSNHAFTTTRGGAPDTNFLSAVKEGLGSDGGLYMLKKLTKMPRSQLIHFCESGKLTYVEGAQMIIEQLVDYTLPAQKLHEFIVKAYDPNRWCGLDNICPLRPLLERQQRSGERWMRNVSVLELYHGPTAAFKDFALQLFPYYFNYAITKPTPFAPPTSDISGRSEAPLNRSESNSTSTASSSAPLSARDSSLAAQMHFESSAHQKGPLKRCAEQYLILAATSGDTGVAAISGFLNVDSSNIKVSVLYPLRGVSPVQQLQMINMDDGDRVRVYGVESDFDFCQNTVKSIFNDVRIKEELRNTQPHPTFLSSANSINWGRLVPQVAYYFWCYRQLVRVGRKQIPLGEMNSESGGARAAASSQPSVRPSARGSGLGSSGMRASLSIPSLVSASSAGLLETMVPSSFQFGYPVDVVVPCGNFGNILAAFMAKLMGLPLRRLVVASNENDVLCEFIQTGRYTIASRSLSTTASPSIDILVASNVERFLYLLSGGDVAFVSAMMSQLHTHKSFTLPDHLREIMQRTFWAGKCAEAECAKTIQGVFQASRGQRLLDTHTAVAVFVAQQYREEMLQKESQAAPEDDDDDEDEERSRRGTVISEAHSKSKRHSQLRQRAITVLEVPLVVASTAHWSKFPDAVYRALRGRSMTKKLDPYRERKEAEAATSASHLLSGVESSSVFTTKLHNAPSIALVPGQLNASAEEDKPEFDLQEVVTHTLTRYREIGREGSSQSYSLNPPHPELIKVLEKHYEPTLHSSNTNAALLPDGRDLTVPNAALSPARKIESDESAIAKSIIDFCKEITNEEREKQKRSAARKRQSYL